MDAPKKKAKEQVSDDIGEEKEPSNVSQHEHTQSLKQATSPVASSQEIEQLITELLATIGHEFRVPLAVIKDASSMLLHQDEQLSSEERRASLQQVQEASLRMEFLTKRLLEMAELEAGALQINQSFVDFPTLTREAIARAQQQVPEQLRGRLTFQIHVRDEARNPLQSIPPVKGDRRHLRAILEHLLENAIRFSPEGGKIDVIIQPVQPSQTLELRQPGSPFLEICVCDYGIGILDEHLERIFERFYRVDRPLTGDIKGLGLGLTICRHLVALYQGRIWAESCAAEGSAFHLWLPMSEPVPIH